MVEFEPEILRRMHALCARYCVSRLELTGSAARDDFDPETSDLDFLLEFLPDSKISALTFVEFAVEFARRSRQYVRAEST